MGLESIPLAFGALKSIGEIAKGMVNLHTMAEVQTKTAELNWQILDAQQKLFSANAEQTSLVERIRDLEEELRRIKDWDAQKQRYELAMPVPGCMVYALKKSMSAGQPAHYLCTACFQQSQQSIMQGKERIRSKGMEGMLHAFYLCPVCKNEAVTGWVNVEPPKYFEDISPTQ